MKGFAGLSVAGLVVVVVVSVCLIRLAQWTNSSCDSECLETYFSWQDILINPALLPLLRDKYLHPPPSQPNISRLHTRRLPWRELLDWDKLQITLEDLWKDQSPGVFVEVGAADGEFMSQTLVLERNLSWTGLLVEPDPRSYAILQQRKRNAWTSPLCIEAMTPKAGLLWMHHQVEDLPPELQGLVLARSKMMEFTVQGDLRRGTIVRVPCFPLSRVLMAANLTAVDMLAIATGTTGDQDRIKDVTYNKKLFHVKTLLMQYSRMYLIKHPYPIIKGYIIDMERSRLLIRLYWRKSECRLLQEGSCRRVKTYDLVEACREYLCYGFAVVWTHAL
ncbi:hypothetical protein O3P69_018172 [Scylla paramamosain]|uniref:Uncharacterized protein n=1 Tax=Scylla paramamosain TaxID=85552 RepID=A0AAW0TIV5_SCYPA